jgi:hypothetical protein
VSDEAIHLCHRLPLVKNDLAGGKYRKMDCRDGFGSSQ